MIQLNLLPDLKKAFLHAQRARNRVIGFAILGCVIAVGATALAAFYVYAVQTVQINLVNGDIKKKTSDLQNTKDIDKYLTIQNQLAALPDLHGKKNVYSRFFGFLPVLNPGAPNNVTLTNFEVGDTDTLITFIGKAPTFESLNVFKDTLAHATVTYQLSGSSDKTTENLLSDVTVESSGLGQDGANKVVSFTIKAHYNQAALKVGSTSVAVSVPNIQTSANQTPSVVFEGSN